ncbi:hypothetical protein HMPREF2767_07385 [Nosocomiicoccus sp. HMSC067E10]|uniref:nuclease-related domain-containing protein n=1 Tax=Nosocomiicoccus sp. HMSC067E10 TaxID=1739271 RepID=UPI0008A4EC76|nr:nuclease-related domain-containing protein [Nosocomiicoccus sp. HMSC067E10]OFL48705.1 hypothetical protein HMPREF2767_07385 [Nosocomiicoccus sp. HMSC067E10]
MKSLVHRQLDALKWRMDLTNEQLYYLENLTRGYSGEEEFKGFLMNLVGESACILTDFTFSVDGVVRQIDALVVFRNAIFIFEVKNYHGDYLFRDGDFYNTKFTSKVRSPLEQLDNTVILFNRLTQKVGITLPIKSYVVFIGKDFHLYESPRGLNIIMRGQLKKFLNELRLKYQHADQGTKKLVESIYQFRHLEERRLDINYSYESLKKSLFCIDDGGEIILNNRTYYECQKCNGKTPIEAVVLQAIKDFQTLFPEMKITISNLYNFTGEKISRYHYRKVLNSHYQRVGNGRGVQYIEK